MERKMENKNIFIKVTSSNSVFETTNGMNKHIPLNTDYEATNGILRFKVVDGRVNVERVSKTGKVAYVKQLESGMAYFISPLFIQALPNASQDAKTLYNRLKKLGSEPRFKILEDKNYPEAIKIQFVIRNVNSILEPIFIVKINPTKFNPSAIDEQVTLIDRAAKLDLSILIKNFNIENNREVIITINKEFIESSQMIEKFYRRKTAQ